MFKTCGWKAAENENQVVIYDNNLLNLKPAKGPTKALYLMCSLLISAL